MPWTCKWKWCLGFFWDQLCHWPLLSASSKGDWPWFFWNFITILSNWAVWSANSTKLKQFWQTCHVFCVQCCVMGFSFYKTLSDTPKSLASEVPQISVDELRRVDAGVGICFPKWSTQKNPKKTHIPWKFWSWSWKVEKFNSKRLSTIFKLEAQNGRVIPLFASRLGWWQVIHPNPRYTDDPKYRSLTPPTIFFLAPTPILSHLMMLLFLSSKDSASREYPHWWKWNNGNVHQELGYHPKYNPAILCL